MTVPNMSTSLVWTERAARLHEVRCLASRLSSVRRRNLTRKLAHMRLHQQAHQTHHLRLWDLRLSFLRTFAAAISHSAACCKRCTLTACMRSCDFLAAFSLSASFCLASDRSWSAPLTSTANSVAPLIITQSALRVCPLTKRPPWPRAALQLLSPTALQPTLLPLRHATCAFLCVWLCILRFLHTDPVRARAMRDTFWCGSSWSGHSVTNSP